VLEIHVVRRRWLQAFALASGVSVALATEKPAPTKLATHALRGPFARLGDFCRELQKGGLLRCSSPLASLDRRGTSEARIDEARLVPLVRARGGWRPEEAAIALKVRAGWFVDVGEAEARAAKPGSARVAKQKATSEWLDDVGSGILGVSLARTGEVRQVTQEDGEPVELSSELDEADRRFCGLDASGTPRCSSELLERCYGGLDRPTWPNDYSADFDFESQRAILGISANGKAGPSCAFGVALADGRYTLPFAGIPSPAERDRGVLHGPFPSIESYCSAIRHGTKQTCVLARGRWNQSVKTIGTGADSPRLRLLRVKDDMAGLTVEYCRLGIQAHGDWYFTRDDEVCQGTFGEMATVKTEARSVAWVSEASEPTFVLTTRRGKERAAYGTDLDNQRPVGVSLDEAQQAALCVVPKTGAPRCGAEYLTACRDAEGTWREAHWSFEHGALTFPASERIECDSGATLGSIEERTDE
jgi:hypothetical protein